MDTKLRLCLANIPTLAQVNTETGYISGPFSQFYLSLVEMITRKANLSIHAADKIGDLDPTTMIFDGCLGQLQMNESDLHIPIVEMEFIAPNLQPVYVALASKATILSLYDSNSSSVIGTDVMDAFHSFTSSLWLAAMLVLFGVGASIFLTFMANYLMIGAPVPVSHYRKRMMNRMSRSMKQVIEVVIGNLLKQHSSYSVRMHSHTARFLLLLLAVYVFILSLHFSSMIKTEMVVQKRPETISSYQEILSKPNVKPVFAAQLSTHREFERAPPDSLEGMIWQRALRIGLKHCRLFGDIFKMTQVAEEIMAGNAVYLGDGYLAPILIANVCAVSRSTGTGTTFRSWANADPHASEVMTGSMQTSFLSPASSRMVYRFYQTMFEYSIFQNDINQMADTSQTAPEVPRFGKEMQDCVANKIIYPDNKHIKPDAGHYVNLFVACTAAIMIAVLVLLIEKATRSRYRAQSLASLTRKH